MAFRGDERRLRTRYRIRVPFLVKGANGQVRGITRNISLLGISAYAESSLPQVQPVQCLLELPSKSEPLKVQGTVIRCHPLETPHADGPYELGIFFKEFQGAGETELIKFLNQVALDDQIAIKDGYRELKARLAARRRKKRTEGKIQRRFVLHAARNSEVVQQPEGLWIHHAGRREGHLRPLLRHQGGGIQDPRRGPAGPI